MVQIGFFIGLRQYENDHVQQQQHQRRPCLHHDSGRSKQHRTDGKQTFSQRIPKFKPPRSFAKSTKKEPINVTVFCQCIFANVTIHGQSIQQRNTKGETEKQRDADGHHPWIIFFAVTTDVKISV